MTMKYRQEGDYLTSSVTIPEGNRLNKQLRSTHRDNIKENYSRNYNSLILGFKLLTYLDDLNEQAVNINYG